MIINEKLNKIVSTCALIISCLLVFTIFWYLTKSKQSQIKYIPESFSSTSEQNLISLADESVEIEDKKIEIYIPEPKNEIEKILTNNLQNDNEISEKIIDTKSEEKESTPEHVENKSEKEVYEEKYILGDVNEDGNLDIADVMMLSKFLNNKIHSIKYELADINKDGKVDISDLMTLYKTITK